MSKNKDLHVMFGVVEYWDGQICIIRAKSNNQLYQALKEQISPWHIPSFKPMISVACTMGSQGIEKIEHIDGQWDWLKVA